MAAATEPAWYACDPDGRLLRVEASHAAIRTWAMRHYHTRHIALCVRLTDHDYWYVLTEPGHPTREQAVRVLRADQAARLGLDADQQPRYPAPPDPPAR